MKLTKSKLKQIIKEEKDALLKEKAGFFSRLFGMEQSEAKDAIEDITYHNSRREWAGETHWKNLGAWIDEAVELRSKYSHFAYPEYTPDQAQRAAFKDALDNLSHNKRTAEREYQAGLDQDEEDAARDRAREVAAEKRRQHLQYTTPPRPPRSPGGSSHKSDFDRWQDDEGSYNYMTRMEESKMKLTKSKLKQIIQEELKSALSET